MDEATHHHKHKQHEEQWSSATSCGSGDHHAPRGEDELQDMRAMWKSVLEREGKLAPSAVRPSDVARKPEPGEAGA